MRVWTEEEVARFLEAARRSKHYPLFVLALSTHATILLRKGVQPKVVAERLGHASVKVTLDTYSHVLPDTQHEAVKAIESVLWTGIQGVGRNGR
ncbi:Phage integrase family protein [Desulfofundulus australicus DSM 11792]|uniref:Phage integrase family protein n=1 Tax=Desulfofundulus australicus DSM 11792 TaxID=1121425 RepID=A0A1M5CE28_9FIRM|nr:Phage integrase family protein [Desulfofundulus australicus DSM 11792]